MMIVMCIMAVGMFIVPRKLTRELACGAGEMTLALLSSKSSKFVFLIPVAFLSLKKTKKLTLHTAQGSRSLCLAIGSEAPAPDSGGEASERRKHQRALARHLMVTAACPGARITNIPRS